MALLSLGALPLNEKIAPCMPFSLHHFPLALLHSRYEKSTTWPSVAGSLNGIEQSSNLIALEHMNGGCTSSIIMSTLVSERLASMRMLRAPPSTHPAPSATIARAPAIVA